MKGIQYCGGYLQYCGGERNNSTCGGSLSTVGVPSVLWRLFSTVGDSFSTVEGIQYIGGITSVQVLWRLLSTVEIRHLKC